MADQKPDPMLNPDMKKYYYPPGTTEPVLRPEFANDVATDDAPVEKGKPAKPADSAPNSKK